MIYECYIIGGELYHHGIKGQKWGKRNGPPYPLGVSAHSSSEKKAGWRSSLKEGNAEGPSNVSNNRNRRNFRNNAQKRGGTTVYNITNNYNKPTKPKDFSDKTIKEILNEQKNFNEKAIVAGAVTLGAIATVAAGAGVAKALSANGKSHAAKVVGKIAGKTLDMAKRSAENNIFNIGVAAVAAMGLHAITRNNQSNDNNYQNQSGMKESGIRSYIAKKQNEKVNESFRKWKESDQNRDDAIAKGKEYNQKRLAYERNKNDQTKKEMKESEKVYKQALKKNTTYRKGVVKEQVGQDVSRMYLSEAKKVKKELDKNPNNKELSKTYKNLMDTYNVERARARTVADKYANRSRAIASAKRATTIAIKGTATAAAIGGGLYAANKVLEKNGKKLNLNTDQIMNYLNYGKKILRYV